MFNAECCAFLINAVRSSLVPVQVATVALLRLQMLSGGVCLSPLSSDRLPFHPLVYGDPWKIICKSSHTLSAFIIFDVFIDLVMINRTNLFCTCEIFSVIAPELNADTVNLWIPMASVLGVSGTVSL